MRLFFRAGLAGLLITSFLVGCAYVPPDMMPAPTQGSAPLAASPFAHAGVVIAPTTGVHTSFWHMVNGDVMVQIPTFQEALIRSMRQSALFASVSDDGVSQYQLHAEILTQDRTTDRAVLVIRYVLRDSDTRRDVLVQEIETSSSSTEDSTPGAASIGGEAALSRAAFRAAGKNIGLLLAKLRTIQTP